MKLVSLLSLVLLSTQDVVSNISDQHSCPCDSKELCLQKHFENHREVTVITENKSDWKKWKWEGIHNVINAADEDIKELMCHAHSRKANYGILVKMNSSENFDIIGWMNDSLKRAHDTYANIIAVDLLDFVGGCHRDEKYGQRVENFTTVFADRVHLLGFKLACILPWKPPCFQTNCDVTKTLNQSCDFIWTSPESYITECDTHCRAKATMPISNLIIGTDEYLYNEEVPPSKYFIGIPWHGYDYKCAKFLGNVPPQEPVCKLPTKGSPSLCDFKSSRTKMSFYELESKYPVKYEDKSKWSKLYNSNYFIVNDTTGKSGGGVHQIWYESDTSLYEKYKFALDMKVRGVVIWTVDDLVNYDKGDAKEWNWLLHTMMVSGEPVEHTDMSMALKAMAIGVGCFIGGVVIGAVITTIIARKQMKYINRRYRAPFHKDEDDETANFHEDDKYL